MTEEMEVDAEAEAPEEESVESVQEWQDSMIGVNEKMIREFTTDSSLPEKIQQKNWSMLTKHTILANLDTDDREIFVRSMRNMLTRRRQYLPYYKIDPEMIDKDSQVIVLAANLSTRAVGNNRERILLGKGVVEKRLITENEGGKGPGFTGKLKNFLGLGGGGD